MQAPYDQLPPEITGDTSHACLAGSQRETPESA